MAHGGGTDDAGAAVIGRAVAQIGGHATLMRASSGVRAALRFSLLRARGWRLDETRKESFDPKRVLNPGRMWAGV